MFGISTSVPILPFATSFLIAPSGPVYVLRQQLEQSVEAGDAMDFSPQPRVDIFRPDWNMDRVKRFKARLLPFFHSMSWDLYDVRRNEMAMTCQRLELNQSSKDLLVLYYRGEVERARVEHLLCQADIKQGDVKPTRKKAFLELFVSDTTHSGKWLVESRRPESVAQRVSNADYRSFERKYESIPADVLQDPDYQDLIANVVQMVRERVPAVKSMKITAWMMSCFAFANEPCTNSPEGIHQDGADFIVSAFVIERSGIDGGISRVYPGCGVIEPIMSHCLSEGEGIFHADAGSPLYHDVSEIKVADPAGEHGVRSILGFDIYLD